MNEILIIITAVAICLVFTLIGYIYGKDVGIKEASRWWMGAYKSLQKSSRYAHKQWEYYYKLYIQEIINELDS